MNYHFDFGESKDFSQPREYLISFITNKLDNDDTADGLVCDIEQSEEKSFNNFPKSFSIVFKKMNVIIHRIDLFEVVFGHYKSSDVELPKYLGKIMNGVPDVIDYR